MGAAGLNVARLEGLLKRIRIDCRMVDGDQGQDHCILVLSSPRRAGTVAFVEYENQGDEPRWVGMMVQPAGFELQTDNPSFQWEKTLRLEGARRDDPERIARWVEEEFLRRPGSL